MAFWPKKANGGADEGTPSRSAPTVSLIEERPAALVTLAPTPTPAAPEIALKEKERGETASKSQLTRLGEITSVLMRSKQHRLMSLAELEGLTLPAIRTGQYSMAEAQSKSNGQTVPVGVVFWASVSPEVNSRLTDAADRPVQLTPDEWSRGDSLWLIDAVGDPKVIQAMLKTLKEKQWDGRVVRFKIRDASGHFKITSLP
jgi:hemolysin-activating ACP:hemolysin acyltransferase